MPVGRIPFGFEESGDNPLAGANELAVNVLIDGKGAVRRRPGITTLDDAPDTVVNSAGIDGVYVTEFAGEIFAVSASPPALRSVYRVAGGSVNDLTNGSSDAGLRGTARPVFASTEALVFITGGDDVQKIILDGYQSARLGGGPPLATHCLVNANRLVLSGVESPRSQLRYSDQGIGDATAPFEEWTDPLFSGAVQASARKSPVVAIHENTNEVWAFLGTGTQVFTSDNTLVFGETRSDEHGCSAPYSVTKYREGFAWINHSKQIVMSGARGSEVISGPIQKTLDEIDIAGAWGFAADLGQFSFLAWMFPAAGFGFIYQVGGGWSRWAGFDGNNWTTPKLMSVAQRWGAAKQYVVGTTDGYIGQLSLDALDDLGSPIRSYCRSGYLSRGSQSSPDDGRKMCNGIKLTFDVAPSTSLEDIGWVRWRDEDGQWRERVPVRPRGSVVDLRSLGTYRRRQWEFEWRNDADVTLISATEDYQVLST